MPRYTVNGIVTGGKFLGIFEADTPEGAIDQALESDEAWVHLCHQCSRQVEDPEIHSAVADLEKEE